VARCLTFVSVIMSKRYAIIYGSTSGNSRRVAKRIYESLDHAFIFNSKDYGSLADINLKLGITKFTYVFVASTWGDGELQIDMENFLLRSSEWNIQDDCHIVELGNYYGYDDFEFGALKHIENFAEKLKIRMLSVLSVDSMPRIDWDTLESWIEVELENEDN
jgi:flavodoxin